MAGAFLDSDLAAMFDEGDFAVAAVWTPAAGGAGTPGSVVYDAPGMQVLDDVMSRDITVRYRTAVWPSVKEKDQVLVGSTTYKVRQVMPLDDGLVAQASLYRN